MPRRFNPDISARSLLYAAARTIEANADVLKRSHTVRGKWVLLDNADAAAKADYDDLMLLVKELRARAPYAE